MKPVPQEKINHGTQYTKIPQNPYTDKVVDGTVEIQKQFPQMQTMHRVGEGNSEKFLNVSDMQVPDEDDRHGEKCRRKTIKANNKIVKERIWTLVSLSPNRH